MKIPENVEYIINELDKNGYEGYAVGGCVRDTLLGRQPDDWDITTSATPKQTKSIFRRTIDTGIQHGTVTVMIDKAGYEVTTYRCDGEYEDHRHPKEVTFSSNLEEDLKRRDFTINAMAYNHKSGIVDLFGGQEDIEKKVIRCVGDANDRFDEDALRMLRGVRFAGQLQFEIEEESKKAIENKADTLVNVSAERIRTELTKLIISDGADRLLIANECGLTPYFLPELDTMLETKQNNPHHCYTVGLHSINAILNINRLAKEAHIGKKERVALAYAGLLHDVGKPLKKTTDDKGVDHFYGHPAKSAHMSKEILQRLKFDNDTIRTVFDIIMYHDNRYELCLVDGEYSKKGKKQIRKLVSKIGKDRMPLLFMLQRADVLAQSDYCREEKLARLDAAARAFDEIIAAGDAVTIKELVVGGNDMMEIGAKGEQIGELLKYLLSVVLDSPEKNNKQTLMQLAKERFNVFKQ